MSVTIAGSHTIVLRKATKEATVALDEEFTSLASLTMRAVSNTIRLRILNLLQEHPVLTVKELYIYLRIEQSAVSQHLSVLRDCGLVISAREGKYIAYRINQFRIAAVNQFVKCIAKECAKKKVRRKAPAVAEDIAVAAVPEETAVMEESI